jgi:hypothetical protein
MTNVLAMLVSGPHAQANEEGPKLGGARVSPEPAAIFRLMVRRRPGELSLLLRVSPG